MSTPQATRSPRIRSLLASGNGAVVVHRLLQEAMADYRLVEISPLAASLPPLYRRAARAVLADAEIAHLLADCGPAPVPPDCARLLTFHNFYIDDESLADASVAQRLFYRHVMAPAVRRAVAQADRIVVVSRFLAGCVHALAPRAPVQVVYNGIDTRRFVPVAARADRPLRVLFVGNPSRRKGFDLLMKVAAALPAGVELAYTAGLRGEQPATARGLLALGRVPYLEMHTLYQQADVLLFPTRREGFGLCVAEAMACGLPVVSTRCSAIPELVDEGRGGFLLPPDDWRGMADAVRRLLADASLREDMGNHNRARAERDFDVRRMQDEYRALFAGLTRR